MKRDPIPQMETELEILDRKKKAESLYFWEQIELEIKKMWEEQETPEEKARKMREPTFVEAVTEILYYHDPMHFAEFGFPEDEYDIEAYPIVYNLYRVDDIVSLRWMIYEIFIWKFSEISAPESGDVRYRHIAAEIWDEWQHRIAKADATREAEIKIKIEKKEIQ
jgi:hypothetical protein